jgi:hypothetical protein
VEAKAETLIPCPAPMASKINVWSRTGHAQGVAEAVLVQVQVMNFKQQLEGEPWQLFCKKWETQATFCLRGQQLVLIAAFNCCCCMNITYSSKSLSPHHSPHQEEGFDRLQMILDGLLKKRPRTLPPIKWVGERKLTTMSSFLSSTWYMTWSYVYPWRCGEPDKIDSRADACSSSQVSDSSYDIVQDFFFLAQGNPNMQAKLFKSMYS